MSISSTSSSVILLYSTGVHCALFFELLIDSPLRLRHYVSLREVHVATENRIFRIAKVAPTVSPRRNETGQCDTGCPSRYVFLLQDCLQCFDCMQGKGRNLCRNRPTPFVDVYSWGKKMTRREYLVRSSPRLFLSGICFEWSLCAAAVRWCVSR